MVLGQVVLAAEQQVQVELRPVTAAADLHPVPLVRVALQPDMAVVALQPVPLVRVDLLQDTAVAAQVALRQVLPVRVALQQVTAVVPRQERLLRVANREQNFYPLLRSAVSVESAESVPWGQQAGQGPVRWVCEAELLDLGLVEPAGPDCSSVDPVPRVE